MEHPKQACYVLCSTGCAEHYSALGLDVSAGASAAAILGAASSVDTTAVPGGEPPAPGEPHAAAAGRLRLDERSDWERLPPRVAQALRTLLKVEPPSTLGAASPRLTKLGGECEAWLLDFVHDLCFDTQLWQTNRRTDAPYRSEVASRLMAYAGTAAERKGGGAPLKQTHRLEAASRYLRLVRELEGEKPDLLKKVAIALGIGRLCGSGDGKALKLRPCDTSMPYAKRQLPAALALALTIPCGATMVLDEREGRHQLPPSQAEGDPGFHVLSPPLPDGYQVRHERPRLTSVGLG